MPVSSLASLFLRSRRVKPARALHRERSSLPPLRKCSWVVRYSPREDMQGAVVAAVTKSETRHLLKQMYRLERVPRGTRIERV